MKKIILCLVYVIGFGFCIRAQDIITLKNGEEIQALVQEIGEIDVKYRKYDNPDGPNYILKKSEIFMIKYANGSKDVFTITDAIESKPNLTNTPNPVHTQISIVPDNAKPPKKKNQIPYYEFLLNFDRNMSAYSFSKQITLWNLVPSTLQTAYITEMNYAEIVRRLVGIWVNYQDKLVMFRTDENIWNEGQVVPFDQITEVRAKIDSQEETKTQGRNTTYFYGTMTKSRANTVSQDIVKGAEVTIVTKSANGVQNYRIYVTNNFRVSGQAIPFVQNIVDEIDFIINEYKRE